MSPAQTTPWFAQSVGNATQVISVVGVGGSSAKMDVYQRTSAGWQPVAAGLLGTAPNPGGGLQYVQVGPNHWWDGDMKSPTYNTMQVCEKAQCPFDTDPASGTENLEIPQYVHAVVMGVNKARVPGNGGAFFLHATDGGPTAGCVAIDDAKLVEIMRWLQPGALIAIAQ